MHAKDNDKDKDKDGRKGHSGQETEKPFQSNSSPGESIDTIKNTDLGVTDDSLQNSLDTFDSLDNVITDITDITDYSVKDKNNRLPNPWSKHF